MFEKRKFFIEKKEGDEDYKTRILSIVNGEGYLASAPKINPNTPFHKELHRKEKETRDTSHEVESFSETREEVVKAFGIPFDDDHVYILELDPQGEEIIEELPRIVRAFVVLIDKEKNDAFYGEGRTAHAYLNKKVVEKAQEAHQDFPSFPELAEEMTNGSDRWITAKGFVSNSGFSEIDEEWRNKIERQIVDGNGNGVSTPKNWFISGTSLSST